MPRDLALVLVESLDRRVIPALRLTPLFAGAEARACHIAVDGRAAQALARDWMAAALTWLPLQIEDPAAPTLPASVASVVEREARDGRRVTVLVPEMDLNRWWQPLLHRGTGRAIAWALQGLENVTTIVLPVGIEPAGVSTS